MDPAATRRRRLLITVIAAGVVLLLLIGVGVYGLLRGPSPDAAESAGPAPAVPSSSPTPTADADRGPGRLPVTSEPEKLARAVTTALFVWDTASGYEPADYAQPVLDAGDGTEVDMLAADIRGYLPSPSAWAQLRQYQTRQWVTIDTIVIPEAWNTALDQAAPGQLPEGATAYTITGTRHRTGTWDTDPVEATGQVSFTVFLTCAPPAPDAKKLCRVLRLSELDTPLR